MNKRTLYIYNLETDLDSVVLATSHKWIENFARQVHQVSVYSTHLGRTSLPDSVRIFELGGGSTRKKLVALFRLSKSFIDIYRHRDSVAVFHHMSPRTAVFPGVLIRVMGIPQALWYSHSSKPLSFRLGCMIVDSLITSVPGSIPSTSHKVNFVGHGIDVSDARTITRQAPAVRRGIVFIGRISPIKRLDEILSTLTRIGEYQERIDFIGPTGPDPLLPMKLTEFAHSAGINLSVLSPIPHDEVLPTLSTYSFFYSGMLQSVDKAALEAAIVGCLVLSVDDATLRLTGMEKLWLEIFQRVPQTIEEQLKLLLDLHSDKLLAYRKLVQDYCMEMNDVSQTTKKILDILEKDR